MHEKEMKSIPKPDKKLLSLMRKTALILLFISLSLGTSHSMSRSRITLNQRFTAKILNKTYRQTGNAFCITSTYANFSVIWTYADDKIEIYRLKDSKIIQRLTFDDEDELKPLYETNETEIETELYKVCPIELDGDTLAMLVKYNNTRLEGAHPVNINDFKQGKYNVGLLDKLAKDIQRYNMWEIQL